MDNLSIQGPNSYYLIKVQVDMVKHVYEQKYSGNLQMDHSGKQTQYDKNENTIYSTYDISK